MLVNQETENQFRMTRSLWSGSSKTGKLPTFLHKWKRIRSIWKKLKGAAAQIEDIWGRQRRGLVDVKERERRQRTCASEGSPLTRLRAGSSSRCTVHRIAAQPMWTEQEHLFNMVVRIETFWLHWKGINAQKSNSETSLLFILAQYYWHQTRHLYGCFGFGIRYNQNGATMR